MDEVILLGSNGDANEKNYMASRTTDTPVSARGC